MIFSWNVYETHNIFHTTNNTPVIHIVYVSHDECLCTLQTIGIMRLVILSNDYNEIIMVYITLQIETTMILYYLYIASIRWLCYLPVCVMS